GARAVGGGWCGGAGVFRGCGVGVAYFLLPCPPGGPPLRDLWCSPSPPIFTRRSIMVLDYYFLGLVGVGLVFLEGAVVALRNSRFPRTDGAAAALLGTVLCALGGGVLFGRLWAVVHG